MNELQGVNKGCCQNHRYAKETEYIFSHQRQLNTLLVPKNAMVVLRQYLVLHWLFQD